VSSIFNAYVILRFAFSALTLLVGQQEGHPACKKLVWWDADMVICLERPSLGWYTPGELDGESCRF